MSNFVEEAKVYVVSEQKVAWDEVKEFLDDEDLSWELVNAPESRDALDPQYIPEIAGRMCYLSYGRGRPSNEYIEHIIGVGHGSVLEHTVYGMLFTQVSRSLTHELVRHRAGFGYSQQSQRYVHEGEKADFVMPKLIQDVPAARKIFEDACLGTAKAYEDLVEELMPSALECFAEVEDERERKTLARKHCRSSARAIMPNATETRIYVTGNARAWRHFIELRGSIHAEAEIRALAVTVCKMLQERAPGIFGDYKIVKCADGSEEIVVDNRKV